MKTVFQMIFVALIMIGIGGMGNDCPSMSEAAHFVNFNRAAMLFIGLIALGVVLARGRKGRGQ